MTDKQWELLLSVISGQKHDPIPVGFIVDSPWLPGWAGMSILDYYTSESMWFEANRRAVEQFPEVMFLPGFWSEFGMCTEPSAFGARCTWDEHDFPFAQKVLESHDGIANLHRPNPRKDGLLPFMLKRLQHSQANIERLGHKIRFAVARGPWNIAAFLLGTTEFMMGLRENEEQTHTLLKIITDFLVDWLQVQKQTFPSIDGIFLLDDIIGFCGPQDLRELGVPYLKQAFAAFDAKVRFFHNDAQGLVCTPFLPEIGVNLFNYSFEHSIPEMQKLTGGKVTLLGNIPPRDVLAQGSPDDVRRVTKAALDSLQDRSNVILSCGGGMPPNVSTENVLAFLQAAGYRS
jgi:uroporphyrinogen-III decarboxylase